MALGRMQVPAEDSPPTPADGSFFFFARRIKAFRHQRCLPHSPRPLPLYSPGWPYHVQGPGETQALWGCYGARCLFGSLARARVESWSDLQPLIMEPRDMCPGRCNEHTMNCIAPSGGRMAHGLLHGSDRTRIDLGPGRLLKTPTSSVTFLWALSALIPDEAFRLSSSGYHGYRCTCETQRASSLHLLWPLPARPYEPGVFVTVSRFLASRA